MAEPAFSALECPIRRQEDQTLYSCPNMYPDMDAHVPYQVISFSSMVLLSPEMAEAIGKVESPLPLTAFGMAELIVPKIL
ncbi:hypothetical protein V6N11_082210 [Hibiscus sabdariffa]|uniref:Uncharacterized protein n=1 Tax=Hibiscus sabdariffa TaxID=183260 RepID=A0ABR2QHB7_9ROSI